MDLSASKAWVLGIRKSCPIPLVVLGAQSIRTGDRYCQAAEQKRAKPAAQELQAGKPKAFAGVEQ